MDIYKIHQKVSEIVSPVYLVGGAVRDHLLNKQAKDYDFTTPLDPDEIEKQVRTAGRKPYLIGKKFGTIGFKVNVGDRKWQYVEVTTFRTEKYEKNSRKPKVTFITDIEEDLSRRDFTINALAYDGKNIIDPHGGRMDLLREKIICVGNATTRFKEDGLRMLRAARFSSQLGFDIDQYLEGRAEKLAYTILNISKERWVTELDKLLLGDNPSLGLDFLMKTHLMRYILPEVAIQNNYKQDSPYHDFDLWTHTKKVIENAPKDLNLRWAALLHDIGKPIMRYQKPNKDYPNYVFHEKLGAEMVCKIASYLKWSNDRTKKIYNLVRYHLKDDSPLKKYDDMSKKRGQ